MLSKNILVTQNLELVTLIGIRNCRGGGSAFAIFSHMNSLTIVAPMTPAGVSAVAALRVSGSRVFYK